MAHFTVQIESEGTIAIRPDQPSVLTYTSGSYISIIDTDYIAQNEYAYDALEHVIIHNPMEYMRMYIIDHIQQY